VLNPTSKIKFVLAINGSTCRCMHKFIAAFLYSESRQYNHDGSPKLHKFPTTSISNTFRMHIGSTTPSRAPRIKYSHTSPPSFSIHTHQVDFMRNSTTPNMKGTTQLTDHPQERMPNIPTRNHDEAGNHRENASKDSEKQDTSEKSEKETTSGCKALEKRAEKRARSSGNRGMLIE
jgi:hypothetical protein